MSNCLFYAGLWLINVFVLLQAIEQVPQEQKESATRTAKMRTLGNIRLIAELFKKSVVPEKIVHMCIQDLTGDAKHEPSENNVEVSHTSWIQSFWHMLLLLVVIVVLVTLQARFRAN